MLGIDVVSIVNPLISKTGTENFPAGLQSRYHSDSWKWWSPKERSELNAIHIFAGTDKTAMEGTETFLRSIPAWRKRDVGGRCALYRWYMDSGLWFYRVLRAWIGLKAADRGVFKTSESLSPEKFYPTFNLQLTCVSLRACSSKLRCR